MNTPRPTHTHTLGYSHTYARIFKCTLTCTKEKPCTHIKHMHSHNTQQLLLTHLAQVTGLHCNKQKAGVHTSQLSWLLLRTIQIHDEDNSVEWEKCTKFGPTETQANTSTELLCNAFLGVQHTQPTSLLTTIADRKQPSRALVCTAVANRIAELVSCQDARDNRLGCQLAADYTQSAVKSSLYFKGNIKEDEKRILLPNQCPPATRQGVITT